MSFLKQLNLRQNWPLWVAGGMFVVALLIFQFARRYPVIPAIYNASVDETVDYQALLSKYANLPASPFSPIVLVGFGIAASAILFRSPGWSRSKAWAAVGLAVLANLCMVALCVGYNWLPIDGTVLKHQQSITFRDHTYQLTYSSTLGGGADWVQAEYLVFQCDSAGVQCQFVRSFLDEGYYSGKKLDFHLVAEDSLYLQIGDEEMLISE